MSICSTRLRRLQAVAAQQLESDIRVGLTEAGKLADKGQAVERYKGLLNAHRERPNATRRSPRRRLKRVLQDRVRLAEIATADAKTDSAPAKGHTQFAEGAPAPKSMVAATTDSKDVKSAIAAIAGLNQQGKQAEALRKARELLQKHPENVAVQVLNGISTTAASLESANTVRGDKEQRTVVAFRDMEKSAIPPAGDVEFPKDWKEKSERRLKNYGLSPDEKAMLEALNQPIKVEFKNARLQDVLDYLSNQMKRTIIVNKSAMDEGQLNYDTPITFSLKTPVATRTALRAIFGQINLTYVVRDGTIQVTNSSRAKDLMITRTYYVGDLVAGIGTFGGAVQFGVAVDQAQLAQNVQAVIEMIVQSVDPTSWQGRGGFGMIGYNIPTQSLIIRQSAEVHSLLRGSLSK